MKSKPSEKIDVWVNVNHTNKSIRFFFNEGAPLSGDGSFMSVEYFNVYKKLQNMDDYTTNANIEIEDSEPKDIQDWEEEVPCECGGNCGCSTPTYNDDDYDY
tara:strand:- start:27 stop:332 length:306 start_codon:yes stop_codon:yes gene_type:complete